MRAGAESPLRRPRASVFVLAGLTSWMSARALAQGPTWYVPVFPDPSQELPGYTDGVPLSALAAAQAMPLRTTFSPAPPPRLAAWADRRGDSGYCYIGPHPAAPANNEPRHEIWHNEGALHFHPDPPIDLHLFSVRDDCYVFVGDPVDFGFQGVTYRYYGAHPLAPIHGGHWCFMPAGHHHLWAPFSPQFTMLGPWYTWQGPYTPAFWAEWPYYVYFYRALYPARYNDRRYARWSWGQDVEPATVVVTPPASAAVFVPGPMRSTVLVPVQFGRAPVANQETNASATVGVIPGLYLPARPSRPAQKADSLKSTAPSGARIRPAP